jgi:hypothetical protein
MRSSNRRAAAEDVEIVDSECIEERGSYSHRHTWSKWSHLRLHESLNMDDGA